MCDIRRNKTMQSNIQHVVLLLGLTLWTLVTCNIEHSCLEAQFSTSKSVNYEYTEKKCKAAAKICNSSFHELFKKYRYACNRIATLWLRSVKTHAIGFKTEWIELCGIISLFLTVTLHQVNMEVSMPIIKQIFICDWLHMNIFI